MVCTGRAPFSEGLGLDAMGIDVSKSRGFVPVDEKMRALDSEGKAVPGLWCVGGRTPANRAHSRYGSASWSRGGPAGRFGG